jgi:hypothetical protein
MRSRLIERVAAAWLAAILAAPAWAQDAPAVVVNGETWLASTVEERKAFLVGAGNMIALETAYSRKKGTPMPAAGTIAARALDGLTLDQVSDRVTRWYEANPGRRDMPAMGVIWIDMVEPAAAAQ